MNPSSRAYLWVLLFGSLAALRFWQVEMDLRKAEERVPCQVQGVWKAWVAEEPQILFRRDPGSHDTGREKDSYDPRVREIRMVCRVLSFEGESLPPVKVRCVLRLGRDPPRPILSYGDEILFRGKLQKPLPAMNPGQFDYSRYLKNRGVVFVAYLEPGKWTKVGIVPSPRHGWNFVRGSYGLKRWAQDAFYHSLPYPENALLDGILLGERSALPEGLVESFFLTGTVHILAVSGLMTAFVAGALFLVLRVLGLPRKWAAAVALMGLASFVCMTGADPPVCRAGLFSGLALSGVLFERRIHGGSLLLLTVAILVLQDPWVLQDLSFQISFLATAGLMVWAAGLSQKLSWLGSPVGIMIATTLSAQGSVWCLLVYSFNQVSPYSLPANLLVVPLALFATGAGLAFLVGTFLHPVLGSVLSESCEWSLKLLEALTDGMSRWPGAQTLVASPPSIWTLIFHFLLVGAFVAYWPLREPERPSRDWLAKRDWFLKGRRIVLAAWLLFLVGLGVLLLVSKFRDRPFRVVFLSVGHGNAVVLESSRGQFRVVDGGRETKGFDRYNPVVSYLRHVGAERVEVILATHPDEDHMGGLLNLVEAFPVSMVFEGDRGEEGSGPTSVQERFHDLLRQKAIPILHVRAGDSLPFWEGARWEVLHPSLGWCPKARSDNNLSVVSKVTFGPFSLLLPGDLEREGLLSVLKKSELIGKVDWLMAPHHGRKSGEPSLCAQGFRPNFVVLSDSKEDPATRIQYREGAPQARLLSTTRGAVEVEVYPDGRGRYRSFREKVWREFRVEARNIDFVSKKPL